MSHGNANGTGRGKPRPPLDTSPEKQRARGQKSAFVRAKMREWRDAHPDWEGKPEQLSPKELKAYILSKVPDAIDEAQRIAHDPRHSRQMDALKMLVEHGIGRPTQPMEHAGEDGAPLAIRVEFVKPDDAA